MWEELRAPMRFESMFYDGAPAFAHIHRSDAGFFLRFCLSSFSWPAAVGKNSFCLVSHLLDHLSVATHFFKGWIPVHW